jgi:peroxiredoxin
MKVLFISVLLAGLMLTVAAAGATVPSPKVGSPPPSLELPNLEGKITNLNEYLGKRQIVLVFFASWSKPCQTELIDLQKLSAEKGERLQVVAVSFDKKSKELQEFISRAKLSLPILIDKKFTQLDKFQILVIPTTFCIGTSGLIERIFVDYDENVKKAIADWAK